MSNLTINRLNKELTKLNNDTIEGIIINEPTSLFEWNVQILGPKDTPFEEGIFDIKIIFDNTYPIKPPSVKFLSKIFHPNIYFDGKICVDILQNEWAPTQNVRTILLSIISLLMDPNPNSPANREAAILYKENKYLYETKIRETIQQNNKKE
jgi:ubiquitin-conjugating enzyme E2 A